MGAGQPLGQMIIELGLDSSNFASGMKGINQQIKSAMIEMKAHLNVMGRSGNEIDKLKARQVGLSSVLEAQNRKVAQAREKYEKCRAEVESNAKAVKGNAKAMQDQRDALVRAQNAYVRAIGELGSYQNQLREVNIQIDAMQSTTYRAGAAMESFGTRLTSIGDRVAGVGKTLTASITTPVIALGAYAIKTTAAFDAAMSQVAAVSGAVGEDFDALREKAREMGEKTKFSAKEAADAMNYMAMAGWKTSDMLNGIEGIMNLAAASGENLATTSDIVTDALTALGMTAEDSGHFADILAAASSNANTNVRLMGETFKYCAPVAGALGFTAEDTAEAIGLMANSGIKASQAGTAMRSMLTALSGEIKFSGDRLGDYVVKTANADGSMRSLNDILADCRIGFSQLSQSEQAATAEAIVGRNAMSGFLAVMNAAPADIEKLNRAITDCSGMAEAMAETMQDNLKGQLTILKSQTDELAISFGDILMPKLREIVSGAQGLVDKLNKMDDGTKEAIVTVGLFAATVGPAALIIGKMASGIGNLAKGIGKGMQSLALWAAKISATTEAANAQTAATATQTAATEINTAANARNSSGLMLRTAKTLASAAASKVHAASEKALNVILMASDGRLKTQAVALNAAVAAKVKDTVATVAHTAAEKVRNHVLGTATATMGAHTIATTISTIATTGLTAAVGLLSAAIKILLGPIGLIIAGITALVAGSVALVKWLNRETEASKQLKKETESLAEQTDALNNSLSSSQESYENNTQSIQAQAGAAVQLTKKVKDLADVENKTSAQKKELAAYVSMLNDSMEGLNLQYNEQMDCLNLTTDEIYGQIAALREQAEAQAAQERMTEILKEQITVREQMGQVQEKITKATEDTSIRERERKEIIADLTEQEVALQSQLDSLGESYNHVSDIIVASAAAEADAVSENTTTILEAYGDIATAYDDLGKRQQEALDSIVGTYETMTGRLSSLTEKIKLDNETTWASIQKNQSDTIAKTKEFSELYAQLIEAGISESYLNAIGATGPESIPLLKDMMSKGTETILASQSEWQEAYGVIGDTLVNSLSLNDSVSSAIKDYVVGESGVMGTLRSAIAGADLNMLGQSITEGVEQGILKGSESAANTTTDMANAVTNAAKDAWDINSPSGKFKELGGYLIEGLALGISGNESLANDAITKVLKVMDINDEMQRLGNQAMEGFSQGMEKGSSQIYTKANQIADQVTSTLKTALDIHSPSRVMRDEVGRNIALGIAEGITQNKEYAKKSAEEIASAIVQAAKTKLDNTKVYTELSLADEVAYWDSVRKQVTDGTQARIDADKQYFDAKKSLNQKMISIEENYTSKVKKTHEDLEKSIKSLKDAYSDELTSRTKDIMNSMGLFEKFTATTELTTTDLIGNLQSQVTGLREWSRNLKDLERRGVTGDMLDALRDMGVDAAGEIALMTEMSDEELDEYISLWEQKQRLARKAAKTELEPLAEETENQIHQMRMAAAQELAEYRQEFISAMSEIGAEIQKPMEQIQEFLLGTVSSAVKLIAGTVSDESGEQSNVSKFGELAASVLRASESLPNDFTSLGQNTVAGMIVGMRNKSGELFQTVAEIVKSAIQAARDEAQIHSPSRVMMSLGSYMIEGFGVGMEKMRGYIQGVAKKSATVVSEAFNTNLDSIGIDLPTKLPGFDSTITDKTGIMKSIGMVFDAMKQMEEEKNQNKPSENKTLLQQLVDSNNTAIKLLKTIAEKNLIVDADAITNAVNNEMGGADILKVRAI